MKRRIVILAASSVVRASTCITALPDKYTHRYGNLRYNEVDEVLNQTMVAGTFSYDDVWFPSNREDEREAQ